MRYSIELLVASFKLPFYTRAFDLALLSLEIINDGPFFIAEIKEICYKVKGMRSRINIKGQYGHASMNHRLRLVCLGT